MGPRRDMGREAVDAGYMDNSAPLVLLHQRYDAARKIEGRIKVAVDRVLPLLHRDIFDRLLLADGDIGDRDIDRTERLSGLLDHCLDGIRIADIRHHADGVAAFRRDIGDDLVDLVLRRPAVDDDIGAGLGEEFNNGFADILARASHDSGPALKRLRVKHGCIPFQTLSHQQPRRRIVTGHFRERR